MRGDGAEASPRVLIAGVGYVWLRDFSFGPVLIQHLQTLTWPEGVEIEDLSYHPIAVVQRLTSEPRYDKIIFVGAVKRGREPGAIHRYTAGGNLPGADELQVRIGEGLMGVICLENLLLICRAFQALPAAVTVIEVEPEAESWGEGFTPQVQQALERVVHLVSEEVSPMIRFEPLSECGQDPDRRRWEPASQG